MTKTYQERQAAKLDKFVASLTGESEFFGLFGRGYPTSFYKVYVRPTADSPTWWVFEVGAGSSRLDPLKHQAKLPMAERAAALWAPLPYLADYTHIPEGHAIAKLKARAAELSRVR